jgi:uncharacterized membrane protein
MREMQTQATTERRPRPRIETLADLIFGLSLSIGSIALIASSPTSVGEIVSHIFAFGFTFLILITAWIIYTTDMSVLPVETKSITFLNVALLLLVAIVPYLLNSTEVVSSSLALPSQAAQADAIKDFSSSLFAVDLTGILVILAAFAHIISVEEKKLVAPELASLFRNGRNRMAVLAVIMLISAAPQFWAFQISGVPSRLYLWYLPLISYWVGRAVRPESRSYTLPKAG